MAKKVLILSGSPRHGGNSDTLCDQFLKGAAEAGHDVEKYFISAQLKAVFDRMVAKYETIRDKELYYIMTAAEDEEHTMDTTLACMRGMADCIPGSKEMGVIFGKGVYQKGEILDTPYMCQAYEMGKNV